ncbi:MAG: Smr/MutS family protein, partial [Bacteroidetes bacterium]|nr:Smr/MutS family protein [Bacteroidota bacterium]
MNLKPGDRVQFLNENEEGVVVEVISLEKVLVTNSTGFDVEVNVQDLILKDDNCSNDLLHEVQNIKPKLFKRENKRQLKKGEDYRDHVFTIDLHIEEVREDHENMNGFEILMSQLSYLKDKIGEVKRKGINEFVVIHGVGTGALRAEVEKILNMHSEFVFKSAASTKYGNGATL